MKNKGNKYATVTNVVGVTPTPSMTPLNVDGFNAAVKRQRLGEWIRKREPAICGLQETHFKYNGANVLKVNGQRKTYHANTNQKQAGVATVISDKVGFKERYRG